jgi:hypothetical protein
MSGTLPGSKNIIRHGVYFKKNYHKLLVAIQPGDAAVSDYLSRNDLLAKKQASVIPVGIRSLRIRPKPVSSNEIIPGACRAQRSSPASLQFLFEEFSLKPVIGSHDFLQVGDLTQKIPSIEYPILSQVFIHERRFNSS